MTKDQVSIVYLVLECNNIVKLLLFIWVSQLTVDITLLTSVKIINGTSTTTLRLLKPLNQYLVRGISTYSRDRIELTQLI